MKWLEGWFGTASGALGIAWMVFVVLGTSMLTGYYGSGVGSCTVLSNGTTTCYGTDGSPLPTNAPPGPGDIPLIVAGVTILLFLGVLAGTWLDLRGARRTGRILLLTCATLLLFAPSMSIGAFDASGGIRGFYVYLLTLLAIVAGILACLRRERQPGATG